MMAARRWVWAFVAAGLALRLAFALLYWTGRPLTHDEREYLALGRSLARGEGFAYPADEPVPGTAQRFGRAPGYPVFLAALGVTEPVDQVPRRVQIAQCVLGAVGIWLMAAVALRAGGPRSAVAAAAVSSVYPPLVWMPAYALSESLYSTIVLTAALILQKGDSPLFGKGDCPLFPAEEKGTAAFGKKGTVPFFGGILAGAAILIRPVTLFFLPLAALWMVRKRAYSAAAVFLVAATLCVLPWTIRNHRTYGRWIAVASEGGVTFWTGNHPLAVGDGDLSTNLELKRAELEFRSAHAHLTPEQLEPLYYRDALAWIRREPGAWLALLGRKVFYTVVPIGPSYAVHSTRYVAASVAAYLIVLPAAIAGAWRWRRSRARTASPAPLWLMAAATVLAGLIFFPQERFRLPVIDPALIVTGSLIWKEWTS